MNLIMDAFAEQLSREYFELFGFYSQLRSSLDTTLSPSKVSRQSSYLFLKNPGGISGDRKPGFLLFPSELAYLESAVLYIHPWHIHPGFTAKQASNSSEVVRYVEKKVVKLVKEAFPSSFDSSRQLRVLLIPALALNSQHRERCEELLRPLGVDAVISYGVMLRELTAKADLNTSSPGLRETLKVLKACGIIPSEGPELGL